MSSDTIVNINGGFPPLNITNPKINEEKTKETQVDTKRYFSTNTLNISDILSNKKVKPMIETPNEINIIESL